LPAGAVGAAFFSQVNGYGLFNIWLTDTTAGLIAAFFLLDLAIYFQHRIFHAVPLLWRLHRVHHSDIGFDVTTALRFHPLEILLSLLIKMSLIVILGAPIISVIIFEIVLNGAAMFNHANMNITKGLDRLLRLFVVTPDMHRIHHSVHNKETNSNFGFNIPWWDRLFGTYTDQPRDGHDEMLIGLAEFRQQPDQRLDKLLVQPFRKTV
ncbi:MAG: sterol desaturase/sphingolipid hydroxylase (fatty acid hydroxylase superfamily), partial [Parasphingorhabdus sp.]